MDIYKCPNFNNENKSWKKKLCVSIKILKLRACKKKITICDCNFQKNVNSFFRKEL